MGLKPRYLLRFDDLCPTMDHERWVRIMTVLDRHGVTGIASIVPDNQDPNLCVDPPDPGFWPRMRALQDKGWTIGLHGYQHRFASAAPSLVPISPVSEFSGLPEAAQREKLERGIAILNAHGLQPLMFVAPRHAFDAVTVRALACLAVRCISDGFTLFPFVENDMIWIPQQRWRLRAMPWGVWTFCLHPNTCSEAHLSALDTFLSRHRRRFATVAEIMTAYASRPKSIMDQVFERWCYRRLRLREAAREM